MPIRPFAIPSQDNPENFCKASPNILHASAKAIIAILVEIGIGAILIASNPLVKIFIDIANAINDLAKLYSSILANFCIALAKISIALANAITEIPALTKPVPLNEAIALEINLKDLFSIKNIVPIAITDLVISAASKATILLKEAAKIPSAAAIAINEDTLTPTVNALNALLISPKNAEIFLANLGVLPSPPNILSIVSVILSNRSVKLCILLNIPPPISPAKISPIETLLAIHPNTLVILFQMPFNTLEIP